MTMRSEIEEEIEEAKPILQAPKQIIKSIVGKFKISTIWIKEIQRYETMVFELNKDNSIRDELESHRDETLGQACFTHARMIYDYTMEIPYGEGYESYD